MTRTATDHATAPGPGAAVSPTADAPTWFDALDTPLRDTLWRGDHLAALSSPVQPSGHAALDAELPGGGWPCGMLTELLCSGPGIGEWRLLAPALAALARAGREVLCIAPPHLPHGPALAALGLPLGRVLWVRMEDSGPGRAEALADAAWAAEQALKSRACGAVLWWAPSMADTRRTTRPGSRARGQVAALRGGVLRPDVLRRLHLAAQGGDSLLFLLRPLEAARQSSPAPLRLACRPLGGHASGDLEVEVFKRRGPACARPVRLALSAQLPATLQQGLRRRQRALEPAAAASASGSVPAPMSAPVLAPASASASTPAHTKAVLANSPNSSNQLSPQASDTLPPAPAAGPSPSHPMEAAHAVAGRASAPAVAGRPRSLA